MSLKKAWLSTDDLEGPSPKMVRGTFRNYPTRTSVVMTDAIDHACLVHGLKRTEFIHKQWGDDNSDAHKTFMKAMKYHLGDKVRYEP